MALLAGRDPYCVIATSRLRPSVPAGHPRGKAVKRLISRCVLVNLREHLFLRSLEASPLGISCSRAGNDPDPSTRRGFLCLLGGPLALFLPRFFFFFFY